MKTEVAELRDAWQRAKWFEGKAVEAIENAVKAYAEERKATEIRLNIYIAALESELNGKGQSLSARQK